MGAVPTDWRYTKYILHTSLVTFVLLSGNIRYIYMTWWDETNHRLFSYFFIQKRVLDFLFWDSSPVHLTFPLFALCNYIKFRVDFSEWTTKWIRLISRQSKRSQSGTSPKTFFKEKQEAKPNLLKGNLGKVAKLKKTFVHNIMHRICFACTIQSAQYK